MSRNDKGKRKKKELESVQTFIPVKNICRGVIETTDSRYIRILEIEPLNFILRSPEEQYNIISTFAGWLKISFVSGHLVFFPYLKYNKELVW